MLRKRHLQSALLVVSTWCLWTHAHLLFRLICRPWRHTVSPQVLVPILFRTKLHHIALQYVCSMGMFLYLSIYVMCDVWMHSSLYALFSLPKSLGQAWEWAIPCSTEYINMEWMSEWKWRIKRGMIESESGRQKEIERGKKKERKMIDKKCCMLSRELILFVFVFCFGLLNILDTLGLRCHSAHLSRHTAANWSMFTDVCLHNTETKAMSSRV